MGSGRWDSTSYSSFTSSIRGKSTADVFTSHTPDAVLSAKGAAKHLNPFGVKIRESRDSVDNPNSTPVIVGLDVTGSMGILADKMARDGLGTLFKEILDRKPVSDPHLMFMAIGDANCDRVPLQVSQFEADNRIVDQLVDIYIEHGGGGNNFESYNLPWYFAAMHTVTDAFEKRGKKGYLFTVGDEESPATLTADQIKTVLGDSPERALSNEELLELAGKMYNIYHVIVMEGQHARLRPDAVCDSWTRVLGQNVLRLPDHTKLSEVIVSAIQIAEGASHDTVVKSWGGDTAVVVAEATRGLTAASPGVGGTSGVVRL